MNWNLEEAVSYYKKQGAPQDQSALISLLREVQRENGDGIPGYAVGSIAQAFDVKETFLLAIIKRIPSLRLGNTHCLELCAGPNCGKHAHLAAYAEKMYIDSVKAFSLRFSPCMRMCGKGPNIKWDGVIHHGANIELLQKLLQTAK